MITNDFMAITIKASNDLRLGINKVVDVGGDYSVANGHRSIGILQSRPNSGQHAAVGFQGVMKVFAGAVVTTPGYPLTTAASGFVVAAVSGSTVIGRYWPTDGSSACASGDLISGMFDFCNPRGIGAGSGYV